MVKRVSFRPYMYVAFALIVMMFCWESNRIQAAVLDSTIPEDAIRIRILANSDNAQDQWIKRQVQAGVALAIGEWALDPQNIEEAREAITAHLPELELIANQIVKANGFSDPVTVELGRVPFPAKQFGSKLYPAGEYEALRIVIGKGEGQNWWCVLFPPLCFVGVKAKAAPAPTAAPSAAPTATAGKNAPAAAAAPSSGKAPAPTAASGKTNAAASVKSDAGKAVAASANVGAAVATEEAPKVETKFFLWELVKKVVSKVQSLFA
ncbi:stage II sporulation protein R [Paenibacillus koleovorans]|uniref:stage II sporulation protein R n=1 Tax=Paenibacillus koleovorans TaxID=121608 RepID=UPI000FDBABA2|nr:stage II sporulation protein R [Paenibacillus koleovorans]